MIVILLAIPVLAAVIAVALRPGPARALMLGALWVELFLLLMLARNYTGGTLAAWSVPWILSFGVNFSFTLDGLSLVMSLLTVGAGLVAVIVTPPERAASPLHRVLLMLLIVTMLGVFLASDLFLFFLFFELMLLPAFALLIGWGGPNRVRSATRFFIFTQMGSLLMLVSIIGLHVAHRDATGEVTFEYARLLGTQLEPSLAMFLMLGFFAAFAVKLPLVPAHVWQAPVYSTAPVEVLILISAVMAKTAGYGMIRYVVPLFPEAAARFGPTACLLGALTVLYASFVAYSQNDMRRMLAYSSAGHLGYVVFGAFSATSIGYGGVVVQMICHGISVTGLFIIVEYIHRRAGTRDVLQLGGIWETAPRFSALTLVFAMATVGLPGLGNFIGEFLTLAAGFRVSPFAVAFAAFGAVLSAAYVLRFMRRVFFGPVVLNPGVQDMAYGPLLLPGFLAALLVLFGFFPQLLINFVTGAGVGGAPTASVQVADQQHLWPQETHP